MRRLLLFGGALVSVDNHRRLLLGYLGEQLTACAFSSEDRAPARGDGFDRLAYKFRNNC